MWMNARWRQTLLRRESWRHRFIVPLFFYCTDSFPKGAEVRGSVQYFLRVWSPYPITHGSFFWNARAVQFSGFMCYCHMMWNYLHHNAIFLFHLSSYCKVCRHSMKFLLVISHFRWRNRRLNFLKFADLDKYDHKSFYLLNRTICEESHWGRVWPELRSKFNIRWNVKNSEKTNPWFLQWEKGGLQMKERKKRGWRCMICIITCCYRDS